MADTEYISSIIGDISTEEDVIEIPQLIIHGNAPRCWQSGWGNETWNQTSPEPSTSLPHYRGYKKYDFPIQGIQDPDGTLMRILSQAYGAELSPNGAHAGGNPGVALYLKLSSFLRDSSGMLSCKIDTAFVRSLPGPYGWAPNSLRNNDDRPYQSGTPEWNNIPKWFNPESSNRETEWHTLCESLQHVGWNGDHWEGPPWDGSPSMREVCQGFGRDFELYYDFIIDGTIARSEVFLAKNDGLTQWNETTSTGQYTYGVTNKLVTAAPVTASSDQRVIFAIHNDSHCSCDQTDRIRPIFAIDITSKFKKEPYVWRRFGTSKTDDPQGYAIDKTKLDGKWHLTQPFYFLEKSGSTKHWTNVEKYDEEAHE